jgi:hypothetical protein
VADTLEFLTWMARSCKYNSALIRGASTVKGIHDEQPKSYEVAGTDRRQRCNG